MKTLLQFAPMLLRVRGAMALSLGLSLVTLAAGIALLGVSGWFLTAAALTTAGAAFNLFVPSAGVRGLSFVRILSRYAEKLAGHSATLRLLAELRQWLFARLFPIAPIGRRFGRADLVSRLIADIDTLDTLFLLALGPISTALLAGVAMTTGLALLLPGAAWVYGLSFFGAAALMPALLVLATRRAGAAVLEASGALRRLTLDAIDGHQDLVLFGATGRAAADARRAADRLATQKRRLGTMGAIASGGTQVLAGTALLGTLLAGNAALQQGSIEGPLLVGLLLAVLGSFEACALLVRSATRLATAGAAAQRLAAVVDTAAAVTEPPDPTAVPPGGTLDFAAVSFGYDPSRPVLAGASFAVRSGTCVAITGPSGSGKSTIAQLLVRLVDPQRGTIRLNGVDLRQIDLATLRRRVALMTQDAPVFLDSIANNLRIGDATADADRLWSVLAAVGLDGFVASLPRGLDTVVEEAGRSLSAGQARRLCLARSLLSAADVLVLDEPTSGLDAEAEAAFLADLPRIAAGRTIIVITHASLPPGFDAVFEMRAGRLLHCDAGRASQ